MTEARSDALVLFGATGDLMHRKIYPALQALVHRALAHEVDERIEAPAALARARGKRPLLRALRVEQGIAQAGDV